MVAVSKRHGWLVNALLDAGYQQHDLAKAWRCDDAVVSRFISTGKPDLTPERQMVLSSILGLTNDELLARLYGEMQRRAVTRTTALSSNANSGGIEEALAEVKRAGERLRELMPDATVTVTITYQGQR